ncbi:MAG TPA: hypothetical protein V6D26_23365 [Stenomitos sp.]
MALHCQGGRFRSIPDSSEAWYAKASLLYQMQRDEAALVADEKVIQLQPEEAHAWFVVILDQPSWHSL